MSGAQRACQTAHQKNSQVNNRMKLYDAYGREVEPARLRDEQAAPTLTGMRNIYSVMHPSAGLPERWPRSCARPSWRSLLYLELAEEMEEKDLHYLAVLGTANRRWPGSS